MMSCILHRLLFDPRAHCKGSGGFRTPTHGSKFEDWNQGYFTEEFNAIFSDKNTNYRTPAPPSGLVRSSRDRGRMVRHFTLTIFMLFDAIFTC